MGKLFRRALKVLKISKMNFYAGTRHTYGSQFIMAGGSLTKLKEILGHSSSSTTEKYYVHLTTDKYSDADRNMVKVKLKDFEKPVDWRLLNKFDDLKIDPRHRIVPTDKFE
jgi:integrase